MPRTATRHRNGGLEEVPLDQIAPGDRLLIRQGDVVPVDGTVASEAAFVDTSALTGESLPQKLFQGAEFDQYIRDLRKRYAQVKVRKPDASRNRSSEVYAFASGKLAQPKP